MVHLPRTELTVSATRADLSALRAGNRTSKSEANGERQKMVWAWRTSRRSRRPLRSPPRPTTGSTTHSSRRSRRPRAAAAQPASRLERFAAPPRRQPKAGRRSPAPKRRSAPRSPALPPISVALRPARRDLASARRRERRLSTAWQALRETLQSALTWFPWTLFFSRRVWWHLLHIKTKIKTELALST